MSISGNCVLVIDGQVGPSYSFAFEKLEDPARRHFGFLSGPSQFLQAGKTGKQVEIALTSGETLAIAVLQVNPIGLALIEIRNMVSARARECETDGQSSSLSSCSSAARRSAPARTRLSRDAPDRKRGLRQGQKSSGHPALA